jgi:hypothetical protein
MTKTCSRCGQSKPLEAFHRDHTKPSGRRAQCGDCVREAQSARDSVRIAAQHRQREARNRAFLEWQRYRGPLDFERWWEREKGRWL